MLYLHCEALRLTPGRWRYYSSRPAPAVSPRLSPDEVPHVTILRPVRGLDPELYQCLAATFHQRYPRAKLTIFLCVSSRDDPAFPVLEHVLAELVGFDAMILAETEDPLLQGNLKNALGPNPKIRNMSRGYREAKGDILWVLDCNVWVGKEACGHMVDKLCGLKPDGGREMQYKFVHQLPLVVHTPGGTTVTGDLQHQHVPNGVSSRVANADAPAASKPTTPFDCGLSTISSDTGSKLEEAFMSSAHAKFYTAINTVLIAPCILGKSNMFRRSHLEQLTSGYPTRTPGIDYFSHNICEDHLIGDLLWKQKTADEKKGGKWGKHALVFGDLAIQPIAKMGLRDYIARRVRWLRVRKFTVTLATLVEPGTESFLGSLYGAYAFTTYICHFYDSLRIPGWLLFAGFWLSSVSLWAVLDRALYLRLHSAKSIELDGQTPHFAQPLSKRQRRSIGQWLMAWLGREVLAFPIWAWAVFGGTTVNWRGTRFRVGVDMRVHEIREEDGAQRIGWFQRTKWKSKRS